MRKLKCARMDVPACPIIHGGRCRRKLPELAEELGATTRVAAGDRSRDGVAGRGRGDCGFAQGAPGLATAVFDQVQPDPTDVNVADGVAALGGLAWGGPDRGGAGGGSPMDAAKVIAVRAANSWPLPDYMGLLQNCPRRSCR